MADWVAALVSAGLGFSGAVLVREWLIVRVSVWSLTTDEEGREHALRLLRLLKPALRRELPPLPPPAGAAKPPAEAPADPPELMP